MSLVVLGRSVALRAVLAAWAGWFGLHLAASGAAQEVKPDAKPESKPAAKPEAKPEAKPDAAAPALRPIADEPKTIDSASLVAPKLRQSVKVVFQEAALDEVADWLRKQTGLNVTLDTRSLEAVGVDANSPVTDKLDDAPIYLLLDRLARHRIGWRLDGGVLRLQGLASETAVLQNVQYNVGDLLDQKYDAAQIQDTLQASLESAHGWVDSGGEGDMVLLGDVLFIRQDARTHRRIAGLLAALRSPARRVLVDDPAPHAAIRAALEKPTTVVYQAKPFGAVVEDLAKSAAVDLRLDRVALRSSKVTERTPVTFELREQSLRTTLDLLLGQLKLSWILRDGALWVVPLDDAEEFRTTAVFDVRDLCPDDRSSEALSDALQRQVDAGTWSNSGGAGDLSFAAPGVMVVKQTERGHDAILALLENYRIALRTSKRRISPQEDPEAIETKYYRMPAEVAEDLEKLLPTLVHPDSWKSPDRPDAIGTIRRLRSWSLRTQTTAGRTSDTEPTLAAYSILVIEQKRKVHQEIPSILYKIEHGDAQTGPAGMGGGGMGGMGGGIF